MEKKTEKNLCPINLNILVVDHNLNDLEVSKKILMEHDHFVDVAQNGREAIQAAFSKPYDLIFMELYLDGGLNGFETTQRIKALPATKGWVAIIALTLTTDPEDVRRCFQAGMSNFILKPLTINNLNATLCTYIHSKKQVLENLMYQTGTKFA